MEYIILDNQQNKYPKVSNYSKTGLDTITLEGNFNVNKLNFPLPTLDNIVIVPQTSFRFILSLDDKTYTSPLYYNELVTSYNESNPYFIQSTFKPEFIVKYNPNDIASIIKNLKVIESNKKINVSKNVFVLADGSYDYISLVKYIDWIVSSVGLADLETNGVLSAKEISSYILPEIPKPESLVVNIGVVEVTEENIQAYQWEYRRVKNLNREPRAVRETKNTTSREIYRINEGDKFIGNYLGNGLFEIFDDARTARVGYIDVPKSQVEPRGTSEFSKLFLRYKQVSGPFNVKILTIKQPSNKLDTPANLTTPTTPSKPTRATGGSSGGDGASGGGGSSEYGGGYNSGDTNQNNVRYNRR
jgi:uncharacterized membrane protein YgcG